MRQPGAKMVAQKNIQPFLGNSFWLQKEQGKPSNYARDDTFLNLTFSRNRLLDTVFMRKRNARKKTEGSINIPALIKFPHFSLTLPFSSGQYQSTLHSG